ncbi:MAG TPA: hypothetical protein VKY89_07335 [Thermoanaerobaculia bacterium]|nr:hypothetical protein [Thermoanaerobaculia bacterium]
MTTRLLTIAASGWLLVALLTVTIRLPYRWRRRERRRHLPPAAGSAASAPPPGSSPRPAPEACRRRPSWLPRAGAAAGLFLHYWLGYAIAALALVHGMASMTRGIAGRAHPLGLQLASLALLAALGEVAIGLQLRRQRTPWSRAAVRRVHFWVMALLVALVAAHVALDSRLLGTFPRHAAASSSAGR